MLKSEQAWNILRSGNERFVSEKRVFPNQRRERRAQIVGGQNPIAIVLGCSDSRVPPEIIFDQGIGDLFVIRVAGNIIDDAIVGSMEYAVDHLKIPLILVLGHQNCGAVDATVKGGVVPARVASLVEVIKPAVEKAKALGGDLMDNAIRVHVQRMVGELKAEKTILTEQVKKGELKIFGGYYHLESGWVEILMQD